MPGWAPCVIQQLLLVLWFTHDRLYMSMLLPQFVLASPLPAVSTRLSTSASPFLLWKFSSSSVLWNFPGKSTGVGCHFLLQGIFQTQGRGLPHCRQTLYCLSHHGLCHISVQICHNYIPSLLSLPAIPQL